jgi:hypothetical protein
MWHKFENCHYIPVPVQIKGLQLFLTVFQLISSKLFSQHAFTRKINSFSLASFLRPGDKKKRYICGTAPTV